MILRLAISVEHRLVIDKQTGRHTTMAYAYTVLAWRCVVKTVRCATIIPWYRPTLHFTTTGTLSPSLGGSGEVCTGSSCLSGARCKSFAYGTADATATPSSLAPVKSRMLYFTGAGLPKLSWKKSSLNRCSSY